MENIVVCSDAVSFLNTIEESSISLVVTDPPYGCGTQVSKRKRPDEQFSEIQNANVIYDEW